MPAAGAGGDPNRSPLLPAHGSRHPAGRCLARRTQELGWTPPYHRFDDLVKRNGGCGPAWPSRDAPMRAARLPRRRRGGLTRWTSDAASSSPAVAAWSAPQSCAAAARWVTTTCSLPTRGRPGLLRNQQAVKRSRFAAPRPGLRVFHAAARVGGIQANNPMPGGLHPRQPSHRHERDRCRAGAGARASCCFSGRAASTRKLAPQPLREEYLLTGALEPTNEWYAIAKLAGLKMAQAYRRQYGFDAITALPTNLYGPGDNFDLETSHVLPALLRKFGDAS